MFIEFETFIGPVTININNIFHVSYEDKPYDDECDIVPSDGRTFNVRKSYFEVRHMLGELIYVATK